jgi:hypothetical protein
MERELSPPLTASCSDVQTEVTHHNHCILILKLNMAVLLGSMPFAVSI